MVSLETSRRRGPNVVFTAKIRPGKPKGNGIQILVLALAVFVFSSAPDPLAAGDLNHQTLEAWDNYVRSTVTRIEVRSEGSSFLQITKTPERLREVMAGKIAVWSATGNNPAKVPHGLIHDWVGAMFIPEAKIVDFLAVSRNYDAYPEIYKPAVIRAGKLHCSGNSDEFTMLWAQKLLLVTAALQGQYETQFVQIDPRHLYSISKSTQLRAIDNVGQLDMRLPTPDRGPGYVWRLYSFTNLEETGDGLYVELEALVLTRDVPIALRWVVAPIIEHLPRNSMYTLLQQTRNAVLATLKP